MDEKRRRWSILHDGKKVWFAGSTKSGYPPEWSGPMTAREAIHRLATIQGQILPPYSATRDRPFAGLRPIGKGELLRLAAFEAGVVQGATGGQQAPSELQRRDANAG
jgi:ABC-type transporter Mla maintaining outer membrane lipid asymmetry ATPase subunit MlaF